MTTSDLFRNFTLTEVAFSIMSKVHHLVGGVLSFCGFLPLCAFDHVAIIIQSSFIHFIFLGCSCLCLSLSLIAITLHSSSSSSLALECLFLVVFVFGCNYLLLNHSVHLLWCWNAHRRRFAGDDWPLTLPQKGFHFFSQFFTSFKT